MIYVVRESTLSFNWHGFLGVDCLECKGPVLKHRSNPVARLRCFKGKI